MKNIIRGVAFATYVFLGALVFIPSYAYANITITPTRIVFEDRDRFSEVTLINTGQTQETYEITWMFYRMLDEGNVAYEAVESSITDFDLSQHIVYTPRRVTLAPGGKQKIRLALRRPPEVPDGEYRAHLSFKQLRDDPPAEDDATQKTGAMVKINVSYSIPVIFRSGAPDVQASIDNLALGRNENTGGLEATVTLGRSGGPYGALGHLYAYNDKGEIVGEVSNAHVFPEVNKRSITFPIMELQGSKNVKVVLAGYKADLPVYAERVFPLQ